MRVKTNPEKGNKTGARNKASVKGASAGLKAKKKTRKVGRPGPGAMLKELTDSGFFKEYRSIVGIQDHCQKKLAHKYGLNELSTPLRRAVHSGLLKRRQNEDGQYEYIAN